MGDRFPARTTPGGPEVEENHLSPESGKSDLSTLEGLEREIRGGGEGGFLLLFATTGENEY